MAGVVQNPEVPVVLACENNVFVAVPQSVLTKESSVFRAELSTTWQISNSETGNCSESNSIQPKVIKISKYKAESVKIVIELIQGQKLLLAACKDFQILADAIMFADYYDIKRSLKFIAVQFNSTKINSMNLIKAMGAVENLEKLENGKNISMKLELRCKEFALSDLRTVNIMGKFVTDNCDNIDLVMRLLQQCQGQFEEQCYCSCGNCGAPPLLYTCCCFCGKHGP